MVVTPRTKKSPALYAGVAAGFPSPAADFSENPLDLNELLITHPAATFFVRVSGTSMVGAGIFPNDIVIVDRSREARPKDIVIMVVEGEFTIKRWMKDEKGFYLQAENDQYPPIRLTDHTEYAIWGVVTYCIHSV